MVDERGRDMQMVGEEGWKMECEITTSLFSR
jgi:hypothetical protein